ncbi:hypothetical protein HYALB_00001015 [Hymenoscyphus albidus]|uniref:Uncharacterized protein n=1 Tax=Hymenoscyphus albidus TaxID=595503 RepID=A0A9N9M260_9HELO|nr:hypothetical protein HYALB_00001015 [Hymenoscyphus albidus]
MSTTFMSLPQDIREKILMTALSVENNFVYMNEEDAEDYEVKRIHRISKLVFFNGVRDFSIHDHRHWEHHLRRLRGHGRQLKRQQPYHEDWRILPFDSDVFIAFDSSLELLEHDNRRHSRSRRQEEAEDPRSDQDQEEISDDDDDEDDNHDEVREILILGPAQPCRPDRVLLPLLLANRQISTEASNAFHRENTLVRVNLHVYFTSSSLSLLSFMLFVLPMLPLRLGTRAQPDVALTIDLCQFPDGIREQKDDRPYPMFIESRYLPLLVDCINTFASKCGYEKLLPALHAKGSFYQKWIGHIPVYKIALGFNPNPSYSKEYTDKRPSRLIKGLKGFRYLGHMDGDGEVWKRDIKIDGLDDDQQAEFLSAYNLPPFPPEEDETVKEQRRIYEALWSRYFNQWTDDTH